MFAMDISSNFNIAELITAISVAILAIIAVARR